MQAQQLQVFQEVMNAQKRVDALSEQNAALVEKLAARQQTLLRLQNLSLSAATLCGNAKSESADVYTSSIECLSKLNQSDAVAPTAEEDERDHSKLISSKYLVQLLAILSIFAKDNPEGPNLISMFGLEDKMHELFMFAESKKLIPAVEKDKSWKAALIQHSAQYKKIKDLLASQDVQDEE